MPDYLPFCVFMIGLGGGAIVYLLSAGVTSWVMRRRGQDCYHCDYYEVLDDEDLCGLGLGLESLPCWRTCNRWLEMK